LGFAGIAGAGDIESVTIEADPAGHADQFGGAPAKRHPTQVVEAQFAQPFLVATALVHGKVGIGPRVGFCQGRPAVTGRVSGVSPAADAAGRRSAARRSACDTAAAAALVELAVPPVPARARGATPPVVRG
jgi:hypothetical protein